MGVDYFSLLLCEFWGIKLTFQLAAKVPFTVTGLAKMFLNETYCENFQFWSYMFYVLLLDSNHDKFMEIISKCNTFQGSFV